MLTDLRSIDEDLTGKEAAPLLNDVGITLNRNAIPFDPRPPFVTSGLRIGLPAATTQGLTEAESAEVGGLIVRALLGREDKAELGAVASRVAELAAAYPPYPADFTGHV
jgi:glycine hydroxymethyltransferase